MIHINFILLILCFLFITVGYSALSTNVTITGDLNYRALSDIRITDVTLYDASNNALITYTPSYSVSSISFGNSLKQIDSTLTYKITVTNKSDNFKKIKSSIITKDNNDDIEYCLTNDGYQIDDLILPNSSVELYLKFKYKDELTTLPTQINEDSIIMLSYADALISASDLYYDNANTGIDADTIQDALAKIEIMIEKETKNNASNIYYDNTNTGIDADNVQEALDILAEMVG